jgi:hypothetical protein
MPDQGARRIAKSVFTIEAQEKKMAILSERADR